MSADPLRLDVPDSSEGERLDRFVADRLTDHTRSAVGRWIREGRVRVDGTHATKPGTALRGGEVVEVEPPPPPSDALVPEEIPVEVLHEDAHLVVVAKPAGLVVHPGHGVRSGTLVHALLGRGTPLAPAGGRDRPGIVHRLDRDTSGALVVAKTDAAHRGLSRAFARRAVDKTYHALVWGRPDPDSGTIDMGIGRSRRDRTKMTVRAPRTRSAVTHYRTMEDLGGFSWLEIRLVTGRTHQIRVHLHALHHPVVGDSRYAGPLWKGLQDPLRRKAIHGLGRLALHASALRFIHPVEEREVEVHAPLPPELRSLLDTLRGTR